MVKQASFSVAPRAQVRMCRVGNLDSGSRQICAHASRKKCNSWAWAMAVDEPHRSQSWVEYRIPCSSSSPSYYLCFSSMTVKERGGEIIFVLLAPSLLRAPGMLLFVSSNKNTLEKLWWESIGEQKSIISREGISCGCWHYWQFPWMEKRDDGYVGYG